MRKILNQYGTEVEELESPMDLKIHTKAPGKWRLIDMETGQEYIGSAYLSEYGFWIRIKNRIYE